jgi:glycosyltransferase involved in cell wall biosynthesis
MDNWRESIFMDNKFTKILNYLLNRTVKRMEKRMRMGLTISKKMADHYKAEYGADYAVLMNCVDFPESRTNVAYKEKNIIKFVYAGGMPIGRHEQLIEVQNSILSFNSEHTTISATLIIYTSNRDRNSYSMLFDSKITEFRDYVPHENVGKVYEEADVLIYTESFEKSMVEYTKYSMSTKIPEYMSSGKPILCYAPETIAVYEYIKAEQTGICAKNKTDLNEAVKVLVTSPEKRKYFGENGIETAKKNHSKNKAEAVLREVLAYNTKASNRN